MFTSFIRFTRLSVAATALILSTVHCTKEADPLPEAVTVDPSELYKNDRAAIRTASSAGFAQADTDLNSAVTKVFGGATVEDIDVYLDDRIKHVITMSEFDRLQVYPSSFPYMDYLSAKFNDEDDGITMAMNIGALFYSVERVNGVEVSLSTSGDNFDGEVRSSRDGVIVLGDGYNLSIPGYIRGLVPAEVRISVLVHEARHSDCTGGFTSQMVTHARAATSNADFLARMGVAQFTCGHLHIPCPPGHSMAGIAACDTHVWGAYGVGGVYLRGAIANSGTNEPKKEVLETVFLDAISRVPDDAINLWKGSSPDMSHTDSP